MRDCSVSADGLDEASPPATSSSSTPSFPFAASDRSALKHLSSVLTYRLGTLASTISGYADLLVDTNSMQERREIATNVMEASMQIDDLLADLRYYSRPLEPTLRTVHVRGVLHSAVDLLDEQGQDRTRAKVEPPVSREIVVDPRLLRQALRNLLQNAVQATASSQRVLIRAAHAGEEPASEQNVAFEVWNDGEIELETPTDVFRPFFTTRSKCLGLGLPLATQIAEKHGGEVRLTANNAAEGGTCFTLTV